MTRHLKPISVHQATRDAPTLARLIDLAADSALRLKSVEFLIPEALRPTIQAGPIDGTQWCLLVSSSAAAAKLKHLLPTLQTHLADKGEPVSAIRLRIQT
jgi:hypothetical protein